MCDSYFRSLDQHFDSIFIPIRAQQHGSIFQILVEFKLEEDEVAVKNL